MVIVDRALQQREEEGRPLRVGLIGAGYMGRGMLLQTETAIPGMRVVACANRTLEKATSAYRAAGRDDVQPVGTRLGLEEAIERGRPATTQEASLLCQARGIDVVIEATGTLEFAARRTVEAIEHGKHVVINAELDELLGPILKVRADRAGVILTQADGDQPGAIMNLLRFVEGAGYEPVLAGNIKGLLDHYRTPETQRGFAEDNNISPEMATSFADGTKIAIEMATVANATGFRVGTRNMHGPRCDHVREATELFSLEQIPEPGMVDYVLGAEPGGGVFVMAHEENPEKQQYMRYFKMGSGPLYVFHRPYHLPHLEGPLTAARAALFQDAAVAPKAGPVCSTVAVAKRDLKAGEELDGIGGFTVYGVLENADVQCREHLLPIGLARGARLKRPLGKDDVLTFDDVERPEGRLIDELWAEQEAHFAAVMNHAG